MKIQKVAVLGSGVMGGAIAALMANAGLEVMLLDIVPERAASRNQLAEGAIERMLKGSPSAFTHKRKAKNIRPGNLEDHLDWLKEADWVVEAVVEKIEVKQALYRKVDSVRKPDCVVSSNTSTLPLHALIQGMPDAFARCFMITHFFNPPRFMPLLELVTSAKNDPKLVEAIRNTCDVTLGKGVVICKDTPGFIANRIGVFWLMSGLLEAIRLGISVEAADAVMGKPVGIPKTGVFGLFDLIGIDLMPLIAKAMLATLPEKDLFRQLYQEPELVRKMIAEGYTGRKGKGGFYTMEKGPKGKQKMAKNLKTGEYHPEQKVSLESVDAARGGLAMLMGHPDIGGQYARAVLGRTLFYTAMLIPEISDDIASVDDAMRMGYNWKYGPFQLIDRLTYGGKSGPAVFADFLKKEGLPVPEIIVKAGDRSLYDVKDGRRVQMTLSGDYAPLPVSEDAWLLAEKKLGQKPLLKNGSASLWDIGDGIACLEITSKMNSIDPDILKLIGQSVEMIAKDPKLKGLVIGGDADNFSVGANLGIVMYGTNIAAWELLGEVIRQGQQAMMTLKYAPFPVVAALNGMALGGGCEIVLHCDAVQAHVESYPGLVETGVGVIPGWGGCKEMLMRHAANPRRPQGPMPVVSTVFETIAMAKVAGSAEEAKDMLILNEKSRITMNRRRLLADAKALCLSLVESYHAPEPGDISLPGPSAKAALDMAVEGFVKTGKATPHDVVVAGHLASVLSGGKTDITETVSEQELLDLEWGHFMQLLHEPNTLARIEHMLDTGKPLRN